MYRSRFWVKLGALALALTVTSVGWSQTFSWSPRTTVEPEPTKEVPVCKIYQLRDIHESEEICQWIASTIPEMVQPGSWSGQAAGPAGSGRTAQSTTGTLTYNAKLGLLSVRHTPAAHAEVDDFLKKVKSTTAKEPQETSKAAARQTTVVPAQYTANPVRSEPPSYGPYPVPAPAQQPKHLFHFIIRFEGSGMETALADLAKKLSGDTTEAKEETNKAALNQLLHFIVRYEGEGIIDANVVEFMKTYSKLMGQDKEEKQSTPAPTVTAGPPPMVRYSSSFGDPPSSTQSSMPMSASPFSASPATPMYPIGPQNSSAPAFPSAPPPCPPSVPSSFNNSNFAPSGLGQPTTTTGAPVQPKPATGVNLYLEESRGSPTRMPDPRVSVDGTVTPAGAVEVQPKKNPPLTLEQIVELTRSGAGPKVIINHINQTGSTFVLTTEQIGSLSKQGVANAVIEHMQSRVPGNVAPQSGPAAPPMIDELD